MERHEQKRSPRWRTPWITTSSEVTRILTAGMSWTPSSVFLKCIFLLRPQVWPTTFHSCGKSLPTPALSLVTSAPTFFQRSIQRVSRVINWTALDAGSCWPQWPRSTSLLSCGRRSSWVTWGEDVNKLGMSEFGFFLFVCFFRFLWHFWITNFGSLIKSVRRTIFPVLSPECGFIWALFCLCLCCRVASAPMKSSRWELCVELGDGHHDVEVTRSGSVYSVSIIWASIKGRSSLYKRYHVWQLVTEQQWTIVGSNFACLCVTIAHVLGNQDQPAGSSNGIC